MFKFFKRRSSGRVPFEQQLETLARCGITLAPGVTADALLNVVDREGFEADPYRLLLTCMGNQAEDGPRYLSDNIWHFDTECIEDHGAYVAIARRLTQLAQRELPLEEITDFVDVDARTAHVAFRLDGKSYRWDANVEDDWVDASILSRFAELLEHVGKGRRFTYIDLGGQDCLIGCATAEGKERLARETGLTVEWLT
jgi:hypothetical protein